MAKETERKSLRREWRKEEKARTRQKEEEGGGTLTG